MTSVPKPTRRNQKATKTACVKLASKITTHNAKCLRKCGRIALDPHHIVSGRSDRIVARMDAQIPLCRECHTWATGRPAEFNAWIEAIYPGRRRMLLAVVNVVGKMDWESIYDDLKIQAAKVGL